MLLDKLNISSKKSRRRVGRGIAAGQGKTAGRGTKGQASRSGYRTKPNFEGGQTPLVQRLPKLKGFKSKRASAQEVKVGQLDSLTVKKVTNKVLLEAGLIKDLSCKVKIIAGGELKAAKDVEVQAVSATAEKAIKAAGGSITLVDMSREKQVTETKKSKKTK